MEDDGGDVPPSGGPEERAREGLKTCRGCGADHSGAFGSGQYCSSECQGRPRTLRCGDGEEGDEEPAAAKRACLAGAGASPENDQAPAGAASAAPVVVVERGGGGVPLGGGTMTK